MGGYGSGRWGRHNKKTTVEKCRVLDIAQLHREGLLGWDVRWFGYWAWANTVPGVEAASIGMEIDTTRRAQPWVRVFYTLARTGDQLSYKVPLQRTWLHMGGQRWWFTCPLIVGTRPCLRRVRKLYLPPGGSYFGCRQCHDLTYRSCQQSDKRVSTLIRQANAGLPDPLVALETGDLDALLVLKAQAGQRTHYKF